MCLLDVFGRIRGRSSNFHFSFLSSLTHTSLIKNSSQPDNKGIEMFIAGDQILKGVALNAVQCAELLL